MSRIAHLSDVHFGRISHGTVVDAIVRDVNDAKPDIVVVSGDLTQRALPVQYAAARDFLSRFEAPVLVVPGNHDVYAWWHPVGRLADPLKRYRQFITDDLAPTYSSPGLSVFGLNSAFGFTVKGGRVLASDRKAMQDWFEATPAGDFRVLVVHHHLTRVRALGPHDVARHAKATLAAAMDARVDLILCGHLHISHIEPIEIVPAAHRLVIASAGTATSNRGRRHHRGANFFNVVEVEDTRFRITERLFSLEIGGFRDEVESVFERN